MRPPRVDIKFDVLFKAVIRLTLAALLPLPLTLHSQANAWTNGVTCELVFSNNDSAFLEVLRPISLNEVERGKSLGDGSEVEAFLANYQGKQVVLRLFNTMDRRSKKIYKELTSHERAELANLDWRDSLQIVKALVYENTSKKPLSPFELAKFEQAEAIVRLLESVRMRGIQYKNHDIAPKIYGLVRNKEGLIVGSLTEYVPGDRLDRALDKGKLTEAQVDEVFNQVILQMHILGQLGRSHGDILDNIVVSIDHDNSLDVRLIDFSYVPGLSHSGAKDADLEIKLLERHRDEIKRNLRRGARESQSYDWVPKY